MLFNSLSFLFLFLPLALAGYYLLIRLGLQRWVFVFVVLVSLVFYALGNLHFLPLLLGSMAGNYLVGNAIFAARKAGRPTGPWVALGVLGNVAVLGWFKYAEFVVTNVNTMTGANFTLGDIFLPLAISFYTFQQISYLVDVSRGEADPGGVWRYATFVIFFPKLITGPILRYRSTVPQFLGRHVGFAFLPNLTIGLMIFTIGLFKKTVIADSAALYASPVFDAAAAGEPIGLLAGWTAAVMYTFQLYFDFSGYCDMAIGIARMFGIKLPPNFHSPLRAASIIDYWRRWHMTLQQFIVSYMFQPVAVPLTRWAAGAGLGKWPVFAVTTALPTVAVFVVIGFWHGAAWTFGVFGLMHGIYLAVNELWRALKRKARKKVKPGLGDRIFYHALTLFCVAAANVMFRAEAVGDALAIWAGMLRLSDLGQLPQILPATPTELLTEPLVFALACAALVALFPNAQQILWRYEPILDWARWRSVAPPVIRLTWRPTLSWAVATGFVLFLGMAFISRGQVDFIYFNF